MGTYAKSTTVSPEKSKGEIEQTLKRYGASKFGYMDDGLKIMLAFEARNRRVRFMMPLPKIDDYKHTANRRFRTGKALEEAYQGAIRQRWRALLLTIKAKLESVESGIETFEDAFMAQLVLANGQTMGEWAAPQIDRLYGGEDMPPLLGSGN